MDSVWIVETLNTLWNNIYVLYIMLWVNIGLTSFLIVGQLLKWLLVKEK